MKRLIIFLLLLFSAAAHAETVGDFRLAVVTDEVPGARQMAETDSGLLLVGSLRQGNLYAVASGSDGTAEVVTFARGLKLPSGLALTGGDLYVGALDRVLRYRAIEKTFRNNPQPEIVTDELPDERHHGWKYLSVGPDGFLYVPVGAPCNICESEDPRFASILRMDPATGEATVYAAGVRNSVGMDWHPETGELWFSDNGRDWLGDDEPAEEVNRVTEVGAHYGYPYVHAGDILDPEFGAGHDPADYVTPEIMIQAHSAALGLAFYTGSQFPESYRHALFIAEHGSWNRSSKVGYRVSVVRFGETRPVYEPFLDLWLKDEKVSGRPNDVLVSRDGSLLISDDKAGAIYRVTYQGE
ncbi:MAG: PQQ-dependent sugar dehydrogenase [Gammaproteobacteria bacterium]|nr:PQQ-dependent sugar dehydrogenase [Gammaproteobacteria bacterium]MDE0284123.1 PQQ-dependent sugar dehydrogenase [Gammaproteobacteria bacterium]MDE0513087.1 PQQ-dependent sugar dehydrogenase [Gammaproteobacteria bacterium]